MFPRGDVSFLFPQNHPRRSFRGNMCYGEACLLGEGFMPGSFPFMGSAAGGRMDSVTEASHRPSPGDSGDGGGGGENK
jgi:hypothetical protein